MDLWAAIAKLAGASLILVTTRVGLVAAGALVVVAYDVLAAAVLVWYNQTDHLERSAES